MAPPRRKKKKAMAPWIPRFHLFEIDDQPWFPSFLRAKVQSCLTVNWKVCLPIIQVASPAQRVADLLINVLGRDRVTKYTYVDFCAGAGGPTPTIEQLLNGHLRSDDGPTRGSRETAKFILTDIAPHIEEWERASKKSENLSFIPYPVDASNAPTDLVKADADGKPKKVFRLFNLAFHHFNDPLAKKILQNTLETADGFGIFELQFRDFPSFVTITLLWPLWMLMTPFFFWNSPGHLFFTYILPIIPFVVTFDGYVSSLRTRTKDEVLDLVGGKNGIPGWEIRDGRIMHTWGIGYMRYIIGTKKV